MTDSSRLLLDEPIEHSARDQLRNAGHDVEHVDFVPALGKDGKVGNAMTYKLNEEHPMAQLLTMLVNVSFAGETPMNLDPVFLSDGE